MKKVKTAVPAVAVLLLALTAAIVTFFAVSASAAWDGGLTDGNEESTPLPFPRGNTREDDMPLPGSETMPAEGMMPRIGEEEPDGEEEPGKEVPENEDGSLGTDDSGPAETAPMTDRETEEMTDRVTERETEAASGTASETTETEKKAGLSFWAVLGAAGCAAAVAGIVLAVTNKAEKKH